MHLCNNCNRNFATCVSNPVFAEHKDDVIKCPEFTKLGWQCYFCHEYNANIYNKFCEHCHKHK